MDQIGHDGISLPCAGAPGLQAAGDISAQSSGYRDLGFGRNRLIPDGAREKQSTDAFEERILALRESVECEAIGVRLIDADGHLIYRTHHGFPAGFCDHISGICTLNEGCICVRVLRQQMSQLSPAQCIGSSFVANSIAELNAVLQPDTDRIAHLVGATVRFQSVAVTPLRCFDQDLGIIHCAARAEGQFTPQRMRTLENTADELARDLFYDALWRPTTGIGRTQDKTRAPAACPICGRRRETDDSWEDQEDVTSALSWTVLGAPQVVCPSCLRLCNSD